MAKSPGKNIESPFTVEMSKAERAKLGQLTAYCMANGVPQVSKGLIVRTLVVNTEEGLDFLGMVRAQAEIEVAERAKKRAERPDKE